MHLGEQLLFGIDELTKLKQVLAVYYEWFAEADYGTVVLVTAVATLANLLAYLLAAGGNGRRVALSFFALLGISEVHHLIETAMAAHYTSGTVTVVPYMIFGLLLLRAVRKEDGSAPGVSRIGLRTVAPQGAI
jgi:hypothetical protein